MQDKDKKSNNAALRRYVAPIVVALILLTAGCAGAGFGGDASPDSPNVTEDDTSTNTTDPGSDTDSDPGPESDPGTNNNIDAEFADKIIVDDDMLMKEAGGQGLHEFHEMGLVQNHESFTAEGEVNWDGDYSWDNSHSIWVAEDADGFVHYDREIDAAGTHVWSYFQHIDAEEARRIKMRNGTRSVDDRTPNFERVVGGSKVLHDNLYSANYEFTGYMDDNGTTVAVFEATEGTEWLNDHRSPGNVDSVEGEMWITENNVIRKSELTAYSGDEVVYDSDFRVTNLNSTETTPPSWASEYAEKHGYST